MVSGSTAVIALVRFQDKGGWDVIVMHVGDSRALVINAEGKLVHCTVDHIPVDPKEVQRIKESGGVIKTVAFWLIRRRKPKNDNYRSFYDSSFWQCKRTQTKGLDL